MAALSDEFGEGTSLEDFEKKAQMLNYVTHRAIFEGFNAHLWNPNSGRIALDDAAGLAEHNVADSQF